MEHVSAVQHSQLNQEQEGPFSLLSMIKNGSILPKSFYFSKNGSILPFFTKLLINGNILPFDNKKT
ncbi:hypothetical protein AN404_07050 [Pediococcus acidilactici]|nr:hypothetical protein AN404_07050 [Pediococcus acidilactici]